MAKAELVDLRLIASSLDIEPKGLESDRAGWSMSVSDELSDWALEPAKNRLWARIAFVASCREGEDTPIRVTGDYLVGYAIGGEVDRTAARAYLRRVARFACYPYFRALFASLTGQANLVFPPLPVLREPARRIPKVNRSVRKPGKVKTDSPKKK